MLCVLGGVLMLAAGGRNARSWLSALAWEALSVGMIYFTGVALVNGWVMHPLAGLAAEEPALFDAMNDLIIGFGWLGNPLFLLGLTLLAGLEVWDGATDMPRWLAYAGAAAAALSWGRGIGSATGLYFLEPLIFANIAAFLWLGYYGLLLAGDGREQAAGTSGGQQGQAGTGPKRGRATDA